PLGQNPTGSGTIRTLPASGVRSTDAVKRPGESRRTTTDADTAGRAYGSRATLPPVRAPGGAWTGGTGSDGYGSHAGSQSSGSTRTETLPRRVIDPGTGRILPLDPDRQRGRGGYDSGPVRTIDPNAGRGGGFGGTGADPFGGSRSGGFGRVIDPFG